MKRAIVATFVFVVAAVVMSRTAGVAQEEIRRPLAAPVKAKLGMLNVPALSPLWLLSEYAAPYNVQIETVMFQRFADARTALASGDLDITAFGPQDITLAVAQGAKSLVGVAGVGSGNDCLIVRKGEDLRDWKALPGKAIGVGAGSISWLKFAASVQENGVDYGSSRSSTSWGAEETTSKRCRGRRSTWPWFGSPFAPRPSSTATGSIRRSTTTGPRP